MFIFMKNPLKIFLIRRYQPHWSQHSGINQFLKYMDKELFQITEHVVLPNQNKTRPIRFLKRKISDFLRKGGPPYYQINDFLAELHGLCDLFRQKYDILFYLDGEHSLNFLPSWISRFSNLVNRPRVIAMYHQPPDKLHTLIDMDALRKLDRAIVLSEIQADDLSRYLPRKNIITVLHGIDVDFFRPDISKKDNEKFRCLSVGYWLRDYDTVIKAAESLKDYSTIEFHIVSSKVNPPSDLKNVHVHKDISDDALLKLYQKSDILFMPLLDATANNVILEALACGLPVITTELPGTKAYLTGQEGFLVPPGELDSYINKLLFLYKNRGKEDQMPLKARKRAEELSWPNFSRKLEKLLLEITQREQCSNSKP